VQQARIPFSMSGMLAAIPKTPLHDRLANEGRLDRADVSEYGTNVIPLQMTREDLRAGYLRVLNELYHPRAYFERTEALFLNPNFEIGVMKKRKWYVPRFIGKELGFVFKGIGLFLRLMTLVRDAELRADYRKRLWRFLKVHRRPGFVLFYLFHMTMHYHAQYLAKNMASRELQLVNSF
jgi:hypothetical protein